MYMAFGKLKTNSNMNWQPITNMGMPFLAEKGLIEFLVEKAEKRYPDVEYKIEEMKKAN
jgi:hypothetical protein